ncbi:MAG TPA: DUF177 domain-containing protein [Vicinamibacterales bacterium]
MLQLEVASLREGPARLERMVAPSELPPDDDYGVVAVVALRATVVREKEKVQVIGRASTRLELSCSRCVEPFVVPVDTEFDLRYLPISQAPSGEEEIEIGDEDINTAFYSDGIIDLGALLREQLNLSLPMKPLCREDCLGLCPECGANRNTTTCECRPQWVDPRLAALRALLNENPDA